MAVGSTKVVQVTNIAPQATKDQMQTLFGYLGKIEDIRLYPTIRDVAVPVQSRICYIKFHDQGCVAVAQHMTNTVFIDRALIVIPYQNGDIPDEQRALELTNNGTVVPGLYPSEPKLPPNVVNAIEGIPPNHVITTMDPKLEANGLPPYPHLPGHLDSRRIEEIRRTLVLANLGPTTTTEQLLEFFSNNNVEIKYLRLCTRDSDSERYALVELSEQAAVVSALLLNGKTLADRPIKIYHSTQAIAKPEAKSNEAAQKEIEEAMSRVKEAHNLISAAIDPMIGMLSKDKRSRSGSRSRKSRSRSRGRSRRSRSRKRSRSRHRRSRSRHRRRSRSRSKRSRSKERRRKSPSRRRSSSRGRHRSRSRSRRSRSRRSRSRSKDRKKRSPRRRSRSRSRSKRSKSKTRRSRSKSKSRSSKSKYSEKSRDKDKERRSKDKSDNGKTRDNAVTTTATAAGVATTTGVTTATAGGTSSTANVTSSAASSNASSVSSATPSTGNGTAAGTDLSRRSGDGDLDKEKSEKNDKSSEAGTGKTEKHDKADRTEHKSDKSERSEREAKSERSEKSEKSDRKSSKEKKSDKESSKSEEKGRSVSDGSDLKDKLESDD